MKVEAPAEIKSATTSSTKVTYNFSDSIEQYVVGITELYYTYYNADPDDENQGDDQVQKIIAGMSYTNSGSELEITVNMVMTDEPEKSADLDSDSFISVGCLAAVGDNTQDNVQFDSLASFDSGSQSATTINLDNITEVNQAVLSGFNMAYENGDDHNVRYIKGLVGVEVDAGSTVNITGEVEMCDKDDHSTADEDADANDVQGSYLGTYTDGAEAGLVVQTEDFTDTTLSSTTVDFTDQLGGKKLTGAAVFVKSFYLEFDPGEDTYTDHKFKFLRLGASGITNDDTSVSFTPKLEMEDNSDNDSIGNLSLLVVGTVDISGDDSEGSDS